MSKNFKANATELFISGNGKPAQPAIPTGYRLVPEQKSERLQLLVRPATKAALRKLSQEQGVSMNELASQILEAYIEERGQ